MTNAHSMSIKQETHNHHECKVHRGIQDKWDDAQKCNAVMALVQLAQTMLYSRNPSCEPPREQVYATEEDRCISIAISILRPAYASATVRHSGTPPLNDNVCNLVHRHIRQRLKPKGLAVSLREPVRDSGCPTLPTRKLSTVIR